MEGVTIIDTIVHNSLSSKSFWCVAIGCLIVVCVVLFDIYHHIKNKQYMYALGMCSVIAACCLVSGVAWSDRSFKETQYVVTVDDSVNFNEFCNYYEIVSRDGDKYVVTPMDVVK